MLDMFIDNQNIEGDLFGSYTHYDKFFWAVGVFTGNGALETIKYAIAARLETFFPHKLNKNGDFVPLWRNYLFIEYVSCQTMMICKQSSKFLGFISFDGQPELVYRNAIDECLSLLERGKYNFMLPQRGLIEKGTVLKVKDDLNFDGKLVRLLADVAPDANLNKKIPVELGNLRLMIELRKLLI